MRRDVVSVFKFMMRILPCLPIHAVRNAFGVSRSGHHSLRGRPAFAQAAIPSFIFHGAVPAMAAAGRAVRIDFYLRRSVQILV